METVWVQSLGSGSAGNALVFHAGGRAVLIDHGISPRALRTALAIHGLAPADLDAILITHEHTDHVHGLRAGLLTTACPVVGTEGTLAHLPTARGRSLVAGPGQSLCIGTWEITALPVSHDAAAPCGFSVASHGLRCTVLTDLGERSGMAGEYLAASDLLVIEANHDAAMLRSGPYPAHLKRRVLSPAGHLSNDDCGHLLAAALGSAPRPRTVWLAHLSTTNNRPLAARQTVERALLLAGIVQPVIPLARHGHEQVWRADVVPAGAVQLNLDLA